MKKCKVCKEEKQRSLYYKQQSKDGRRSTCKSCEGKKRNKKVANNKECKIDDVFMTFPGVDV